jgi:hypothetical protein
MHKCRDCSDTHSDHDIIGIVPLITPDRKIGQRNLHLTPENTRRALRARGESGWRYADQQGPYATEPNESTRRRDPKATRGNNTVTRS